MNEKIDIVITWVDGNDAAWQKEKQKYTSIGDDRDSRYRDYGLLHYWFRGIESCAPWVNNIFFVTWGHIPAWLNANHPKLKIVKHSDYIPTEYLPTYNSNAIEMNFHRIDELSENFVYFNDDMFLLHPIRKEAFFEKGRPKDMLALQPVVANESDSIMPYIFLNNAMLLAKHFTKRENFKKQLGSYLHFGYPPLYFFYNLLEMAFPRFTGFYTVHGPAPLQKSILRMLNEVEKDTFETCYKNRFRSKEDISQYLVREWNKLSGNFIPYNVTKDISYIELDVSKEKIKKTILHSRKPIICINDANKEIDFDATKAVLLEAFEKLFPNKSSYEL